MQYLRELLQIQDSELARLLRCSLWGLETALHRARMELPQDPGVEVCDGVLQEIHHLLQPPTPLAPSGELKLARLREVFDSDPELSLYLGNAPLHSQTDADLWSEIHRKLLRLPEDLATSWRQQALELAQGVGAVVDEQHLDQLPFVRDEIIYPGLTGSVQCRGLGLSSVGEESEPLRLFAGFCRLYPQLIELEPDLHHALKSVFSFDVISLSGKPEQRTLYLEALSDRFHRVQKAEAGADPVATLRAWIDLDEAIHSLVFVPPAERYSWWGKLQQESRRGLKRVVEQAMGAGYDVRIKQLSGLYADICALSKDDLQLDCGGNPGEVLTCLRVYTRINQEESPGRVIFRSLR